jgi:hypothetical protein
MGEPDRSFQELKTLTLSTQSVIEVVEHWSILLGLPTRVPASRMLSMTLGGMIDSPATPLCAPD